MQPVCNQQSALSVFRKLAVCVNTIEQLYDVDDFMKYFCSFIVLYMSLVRDNKCLLLIEIKSRQVC